MDYYGICFSFLYGNAIDQPSSPKWPSSSSAHGSTLVSSTYEMSHEKFEIFPGKTLGKPSENPWITWRTPRKIQENHLLYNRGENHIELSSCLQKGNIF